jgi:hypothetical protein
MISTQFTAVFLALLAVSASAADHEHHWSRRNHRAVARVVERSVVEPVVLPKRKNLRRRTCKPPSNATESALPSATSGQVLAAPSSSATVSDSDDDEPTSSKKPTSTKSDDDDDATKTKTTAKETSTGSSGSGSGSGSTGGGGALSLKALFPLGQGKDSWTTSPKSSDALSLSDATLNPTKLISALSHSYMSAPDGKEAMRATYPKGSWTFNHSPQGGISFYAPGADSLDFTKAKEVTFGYSVFFQKGFDFNKGGKLPGMYGGNSDAEATGCSGGRRSTACYSARLMWRTDGAGEMYTYLPDYTVSGFSANKGVCNVKPESECNPEYGASVGRGSFSFPTGEWTTVSERVRLNDVGKANGELQLWVNGKSVINVDGLILRDSSAGRHRGIQMQTFFGGSTEEWASPKTQSTYFADFSASISEYL